MIKFFMSNDPVKTIALLGATASGKSALALELVRKFGGVILSLDSLSLYRHIDIASAKPSKDELRSAPHYGIDLLDPDQPFNVVRYFELYREAYAHAQSLNVPLFLVGGSSFYLKTLLEGISPLPTIDPEIKRRVEEAMEELPTAYRLLQKLSPSTAAKLSSSDRYRIEKALLIALQTGMEPLEYFAANPPKPVVDPPAKLFELTVEPARLRQRISQRTHAMLQAGLVDEVCMLESRYTRAPQSMKAIGIAEVLAYLDGRYDYREMAERITIHTAQLAKRQRTFNRSQFKEVFRGEAKEIEREVEAYLRSTESVNSR